MLLYEILRDNCLVLQDLLAECERYGTVRKEHTKLVKIITDTATMCQSLLTGMVEAMSQGEIQILASHEKYFTTIVYQQYEQAIRLLRETTNVNTKFELPHTFPELKAAVIAHPMTREQLRENEKYFKNVSSS